MKLVTERMYWLIIKNKKLAGGITIPELQTYFKVAVIKIA